VLDHYLALAGETGVPEDSLLLYFPVRTQQAFLVESAYSRAPLTVFARGERVTKGDLYPPADFRHSQLFRVSKIEAGVAFDVFSTPAGPLSIGVTGSVPFVPSLMREEYGALTPSWTAFTRLRLQSRRGRLS
jgi:hypothetical protein